MPTNSSQVLDWLRRLADHLSGQDIPVGGSPYVSLASLILTIVGTSLGLAVILYGFGRFRLKGSRPALLISLAVIAAGPAEDVIDALLADAMTLRFLLDRIASVVFLICLILAIHWSPNGGRSA